jgi:hypothetical protein
MKPLKIMFVIAVAALPLLFVEGDTRAQSESELPPATEPWLAEEGDYYAQFNQAQIACYRGSMKACDSIWLSEKILMDTWLHKYGRSCGGRVDLIALRRAQSGGRPLLTCTDIFPGH